MESLDISNDFIEIRVILMMLLDISSGMDRVGLKRGDLTYFHWKSPMKSMYTRFYR